MKKIKYYSKDITFNEHPLYISLTYAISGCPLNCEECHSKSLEKELPNIELTDTILKSDIENYKDDIQNVVFLGGEWHKEQLVELLKICKDNKLKTTLYTGCTIVDDLLIPYLDYVKYGPYIKSRGPLSKKNTNQSLIELKTNKDLTYLFQKK